MKRILIGLVILFSVLSLNAREDRQNHSEQRYIHRESNREHTHFGISLYHIQPRGHYETRYERVWVPGYEIIEVDVYGRQIIRTIPGYYIMRPVQVWVNY